MNGWQRIGVILSLLTGVPAFLVGYEDGAKGYATIYPTAATSANKGQAFWDALYRQAQIDAPDGTAGCITRTVKMQYWSYGQNYSLTCKKSPGHALGQGIRYALVPLLIIWLVGYAIAWVYMGFRPKRPLPEQ